MTGMYDGIGAMILLTLILLTYVPFISVALLREIGLFKVTKKYWALILQFLAFLFLAILILLAIRMAPYMAADWLLILGAAVTSTFLIVRHVKRTKIAAKNISDRADRNNEY